ncbi:restriction endonuclease [Streptomyces sp. NBC_01142]|uniref:restriction endonuclease n=1 Tax=Streptomyces sp. NBC_01142 TaxID=2975865 RepID=UPI002259F69B|nr:restriction endonuclease [Streptomyces sp. NBC_01142]MCX4819389.1 restriction endonuclease [Streptomyces sp. NBC_01142]
MVLGIAAVAGLGLVIALVRWLLENWWLLVALAVLAACTGGFWLKQQADRSRWERIRSQGLRYQLPQLDRLHHREFEYAIRDLMRRDGCTDAVQVGGAGDNGADVTASDPFGRRWVIQCKHRKNGASGSPVGTPDLHVLNGTGRQLHGGDVVVLVTNGRFTSGCPPLATSQRLHLVDRRTLGEWAAGSRPLWELLQKLPPPRKQSPLS